MDGAIKHRSVLSQSNAPLLTSIKEIAEFLSFDLGPRCVRTGHQHSNGGRDANKIGFNFRGNSFFLG
jgi:hypothetical protein